MYFPPSLKQARNDLANNRLPEDILLHENKQVHFTSTFKYLGSFITPLLNKDLEVEARIKKAKSIMGATKHTSPAPLTPYYGAVNPGT